MTRKTNRAMFSLTFFQRSTDVAVKTSRWARRTVCPASKLDLADLVQPGQLLDGRGQAPPGRFFRASPLAAAAGGPGVDMVDVSRPGTAWRRGCGPGDWQVISQGGSGPAWPSCRQAASCCNSPASAAASDGYEDCIAAAVGGTASGGYTAVSAGSCLKRLVHCEFP